jgi:type IV pilus assembly protein PilN
MVESGGTINLVGEAFTNDDIVKFVENLKASPIIADVFLQETSQATAEGYEIYKYKLSFRYKGL